MSVSSSDNHTGTPGYTGLLNENSTLQANMGSLADPDGGINNATIVYTWFVDGGFHHAGDNFGLDGSLVGHNITLQVSFSDFHQSPVWNPTLSATTTYISTPQHDIATLSLGSVANVNPSASNDIAAATEAGFGTSAVPATGNVLVNDADVDLLHVVVTASHELLTTLHGHLDLYSDGHFIYTPDESDPVVAALGAGQSATDPFIYTVADSHGATDTGTLTLTIYGANDAPVATDHHNSANAAGASTALHDATGNFLVGAADPEGDTIEVEGIGPFGFPGTGPMQIDSSFGHLTIYKNGDYTYSVNPTNALVLALDASHHYTDGFNVKVTDGHGATDIARLDIQVNGVNDAPVALDNAYNASAHATAANTVFTNDTDADGDTLHIVHLAGMAGATPTAGVAVTSSHEASIADAYGTAFANYYSGYFRYEVSDSAPAYMALALGETHVDTFQYTVSDGHGGTDIANVTVTISGINDRPYGDDIDVNVAIGGFVSGTINASDMHDPDAGDVAHLVGVDGHAAPASFTSATDAFHLLANGHFTFTDFGVTLAEVALSAGETMAVTFTYDLRDNSFATGTGHIVVHIQGVNDAPTAWSDGLTAHAFGTATGALAYDPTGNVLGNDTDPDHNHTLHVAGFGGATFTGTHHHFTNSWGSGDIYSDGHFDFNVDNAATQVVALGQGETHDVSLRYTIADSHDATSWANVIVHVQGANDAPTADVIVGSVTEDAAASHQHYGGHLLAGASDIDGDSVHVVGLHLQGVPTATTSFSSGWFVAATATTDAFGSLSLNTNGTFNFVLNNASAKVDALAAGESHDVQFSYTISDGHGGTDIASITIHVAGANDAPVGHADAVSIGEDTHFVSGNVLGNDVDVDHGHSLEAFSLSGAAPFSGANTTTAVAGNFGLFDLGFSGHYGYVLNNTNAAVQALNVGDTLTETFHYRPVDEHGAAAAALADVVVTIHGANDAATFAGDMSGVLVEAGGHLNDVVNTATATGDIDAFDVDNTDDVFQVVNGVSASHGTFSVDASGHWVYRLENNDVTVQALHAGDTVGDSFQLHSIDGTTVTVTIDIHGQNDAPTALYDATHVTDDGTGAGNLVASLNVLANDGDADSGEGATLAIAGVPTSTVLAGSYGHLTLHHDGGATYHLDTANITVEHLNSSEHVVDRFHYQVADVNGAFSTGTVDMFVYGANDAPVAHDDSGTAFEAGAFSPGFAAIGDVLLNDSDVDNSDTLSVSKVSNAASNVSAPLHGAFGTLSLTAGGHYTFDVDDANLTVQQLLFGQTLTESFTYVVKDYLGATDIATLTIVIQGGDDAPVGVADVGTAHEAGSAAAGSDAAGNVLGNDTDVESDILHVAAVDGASANVSHLVAGSFGSLQVTWDGAYTYQVNQAAVDFLAVGDTTTDVFSYEVTDGHGAHDVVNLSIVVHGANDAPHASATSASITETGTAPHATSVAGAVSFSDVDAADNVSVVALDAVTVTVAGDFIEAGSFGTLHIDTGGNFTYDLDEGNATVDAMNSGDQTTDVFHYKVSDGHGGTSIASITIQIHGQNDAALFGGQLSGTVIEAGGAGNSLSNVSYTTRHLTVSDVDNSSVMVSESGFANYGWWGMGTGGWWAYSLSNSNATVEALQSGSSIHDVFTVHAADGTPRTIDILIQGANDNPTASDDVASATEAGTVAGSNGSGNVLTNDHDRDTADTKTVSALAGGTVGTPLVSTYGTLTLNANGSYTYVVDDANPTVDALRLATDTLVETFTYTVKDSQNATDSATLTVTIHGANDAPVAGADTGSATEAGTAAGSNAIGNVLVNDTDVDGGDAKSVGAITGGTVGSATAGSYGSLTLNSDGSYSYVVNDANATVNALATASDTLVDTFTYKVQDSAGATASTILAITIHGANDAPIAANDSASATEAGTAAGSHGAGNVLTNDSDPDAGDSVSMHSIVGGALDAATAGTYGSLTLNSDGSYTYVVNDANPSVDALRLATDTLTDTFTYVVQDGSGATASATLTVTIHGANDAPVAGDDTGSANETGSGSGAGGPGTHATGNVLSNDTDVDLGDARSVMTVSAGTSNVVVHALGTLTIYGSGAYDYAVNDVNAAVDALASGESLTDTFHYKMVDANGATDLADLVITIHGANDAPVAVADSDTAYEAGHTTSGSAAMGNVVSNDTDVDHGHVLSVSSAGTSTHAFGTLHITAGGDYTYDVNDANVTIDALAATQTTTDTFTYTVADEFGATSTGQLTIHIQGANDAPVAHDDSATATEAGTLPGAAAVGNVLSNDTDVDNNHVLHVAHPVTSTTSLGSFHLDSSGNYTYAVDDANATIDALALGETLTVNFGYTVADSHSATSTAHLTIVIQGANDAPVGTDDAVTVTESGIFAGHDDGGNLLANDSDVDHGHVLTVADVDFTHVPTITVTGLYGDLHVTADGSYTYFLDNSNLTVDALAVGQTLTETFQYVVADSHSATSTATLTVHINGANDAPVASADAAGAYEAGDATPGADATGNVLFNDCDVDNGTSLHAVSISTSGLYGHLALGGSGAYTYAVDNSNTAVDGLALGETLTDTFSYTVADSHSGTDIAQLVVTIHGANDAPVASGDSASALEAGTGAGSSGTGNLLANDTDVDVNDTHVLVDVGGADFTYTTQTYTYTFTTSMSYSSSSSLSYTNTFTYTNTHTNTHGTNEIFVNGLYGTLDVTISGDFTYNVDDLNGIVDALALGETLTDTFTYTMTDNHGATSTSTLTVTIDGANDAPVASNDVGVAQESGTLVSGVWPTGNVLSNDSDVDDGHSLSVSSLASGTVDAWNYGAYGWLWLGANGAYEYQVDDSNFAVDALGAGQTLVDSFTYTVADEHGATSTATVTITIDGANDQPTGTVTIDGSAYQGETLTAVVNLVDPEGLGAFSYQWQANGVNIGANSSTYVLAANDLGKTISVIVSYTDGAGAHESVTGTIVSHPGVIETGSIGADHIVGSSGDDSINGGAGKDRMEGLGGDDTYMVDNVRDVITEQPGGGVDSVIASCNYLLLANVENLTLTGTGNFYAKGNASDNVLIGNSGKNAIYGFGGQDTLTGGAGADTFWLSAADVNSGKVVTITDFSVAEGDKINLSPIDAREGKSGNQPFTWIGTDTFASHGANWTGLLRFDEGSHMLIGSTNADGTHLVEIQLVGIDHLGTDAGGLYIKNIVL